MESLRKLRIQLQHRDTLKSGFLFCLVVVIYFCFCLHFYAIVDAIAIVAAVTAVAGKQLLEIMQISCK